MASPVLSPSTITKPSRTSEEKFDSTSPSQTPQQVTGKNAARFSQTRPSSTMRSRLQQAQQQARMQQIQSSQITKPPIDQPRAENAQPSPVNQETSDTQSTQNQFKSRTQMLRQFHAMQAQTQEEARPTQKTTQETVGNMIPKAAIMIANAIATALELGTAGFAIVLTFFIRFITLGWYNTQMIYGGWIAKGKHKVIGPLTWDPIPLPFPKNNNGNSMSRTLVVIISDIIFFIMLMMPIVFILMIAKLIEGAVKTVTSALS